MSLFLLLIVAASGQRVWSSTLRGTNCSNLSFFYATIQDPDASACTPSAGCSCSGGVCRQDSCYTASNLNDHPPIPAGLLGFVQFRNAGCNQALIVEGCVWYGSGATRVSCNAAGDLSFDWFGTGSCATTATQSCTAKAGCYSQPDFTCGFYTRNNCGSVTTTMTGATTSSPATTSTAAGGSNTCTLKSCWSVAKLSPSQPSTPLFAMCRT